MKLRKEFCESESEMMVGELASFVEKMILQYAFAGIPDVNFDFLSINSLSIISVISIALIILINYKYCSVKINHSHKLCISDAIMVSDI